MVTGGEYDDYYWVTGRSNNFNAPAGVHIMNKNEKEALRKLKKETGLSEEELRKEKKYRKMLSDAQKERGTKTDRDRKIISIIKSATKETKLPLEHPTTIEKIKELLKKSRFNWGFSNTPSVKSIIEQYKRLKKNEKSS